MGMAHRGRLNILANFLRKKVPTLLYEFTPNYVPDLVAGDGDVKYHLGYESEREVGDSKIRVNLAANPSHLEAVNAVVEGKARARQRIIGDDGAKTDRKQVLASSSSWRCRLCGAGLSGRGAQSFSAARLPHGGTIHLIINNQIGFTTMPADARSSSYATDVAKMIEAPILHVNGEKPEELWWAAEFALEFRQKFGRDIVIDMYCYRRQGHNETDQAAFTQPHIYRKLDERKTAGHLYRDELTSSGESAMRMPTSCRKKSGTAWRLVTRRCGPSKKKGSALSSVVPLRWSKKPTSHDTVVTGVSEEVLQKSGPHLSPKFRPISVFIPLSRNASCQDGRRPWRKGKEWTGLWPSPWLGVRFC